MTVNLEIALLAWFVIFCRVGACMMSLPGLASQQIPIRARLYLALGVTLVLTPLLMDVLTPKVANAPLSSIVSLIVAEIIIGVSIGFVTRLFIWALETLAAAIAMTIGLSNVMGASLHENEPLPALASFVSMGATMLIFATDQHLQFLRGLLLTYSITPPSGTPDPANFIRECLRTLEQSFVLALRIASPFLLFGMVTNFAFGLLNRMVPHVPVYFVSAPFLITLALYWFSATCRDLFTAFSSEFGYWLVSG